MVLRYNIYFMVMLMSYHIVQADVSWFAQSAVSLPLRSGKSACVMLSSNSGFMVKKNGNMNELGLSLLLTVKGKKTYLNGHELPAGVTYLYTQDPHESQVMVNGSTYAGPLSIRVTDKKVTVIARAHDYQDHRSLVTTRFMDTVYDMKDKQPVAVSSGQQARSYKVRVLLYEAPYHRSPTTWTLTADAGFTIINPANPDQKWQHKEPQITISTANDGLFINDAPCCHERLYIIPKNGFASVNHEVYNGSFVVLREKNRNLLINCVDLEEYICGVLRSESWPGWPLEVNKVFAIASRSYVMAMIKTARKQKLPYHIKNTKEHQTYRGMHDCLVCRAAAEQTRGIFMSYNNEPILAMFDCCCGGVIPAQMGNVNFTSSPYLARPYACTHCKRCRIYSWHTELDLATLGKRLGINGGGLKDVKIGEKDDAGLVKDLVCKYGDTTKKISSKQFYVALDEVRSFYFSIHKRSNKLVLKGKGYGHHIGLCQWGAREMVRDGWPHKKILQFYYPGISFMKLTA